MSRRSGFSLIELIVTIVLLSLVAAAVAPLLMNTLARGEGTLTGENATLRAEAAVEHLRAQGADDGDCDAFADPCEGALDCTEDPAIAVAWEEWSEEDGLCHIVVTRQASGATLLATLVDPSSARAEVP